MNPYRREQHIYDYHRQIIQQGREEYLAGRRGNKLAYIICFVGVGAALVITVILSVFA